MNQSRIYLSAPHMGGEELTYIQEAFAANWISPAGPNITYFERELGSYLGNVAVAALSSGTAAIHLALIVLGVKQNDEVLCSSFTFSGTCNPILYQKAIPVFIDSEAGGWNMSPELLREAIIDRLKKGKKPKAIIVVHLYGMPAMMNEIRSIANDFEIPIIEDAAEALGSTYHGMHCGALTKIGILSFNGNKIITTSGGGALTCSDPEIVEKAKFLATQARDPYPYYHHTELGYNYRLSNISAGIGRGQLKVIDMRVAQRRSVFEWYRSQFEPLGLSFQTEAIGSFSNRWLSCVVFPDGSGDLNEQLRLALEKNNIESRPLWKPMHLQPIFASCPFYASGTSEHLFRHGLCLPSGSNMTENDLMRIKDVIASYFR